MPALIEALRHTDAHLSLLAVGFLADVGSRASPAVPALIELLENRVYNIDVRAAPALGGMGPAAEAAVPALQKLVQVQDDQTRRVAADALEKIQAAAARDDK